MKMKSLSLMNSVSALLLMSSLVLLFTGFRNAPSFASQPGKKNNPAFKENPLWEFRINDMTRSGNDISVLSPVSGARVSGQEIVFQWQRNATGKLFLRIINNKNKEVCTREISGQKYVLNPQKVSMKPGLFYWVIESEIEMLHVGKFFYGNP
jgi:hypothetical protein